VSGGFGADEAYGNAGDDYLIDASDTSTDLLYGGSGRVNMQVRDFPAVKDVVYCGSGREAAYVDKLDVVSGCEIVRLPLNTCRTGGVTPLPGFRMSCYPLRSLAWTL
jgi:hypothetical protein